MDRRQAWKLTSFPKSQVNKSAPWNWEAKCVVCVDVCVWGGGEMDMENSLPAKQFPEDAALGTELSSQGKRDLRSQAITIFLLHKFFDGSWGSPTYFSEGSAQDVPFKAKVISLFEKALMMLPEPQIHKSLQPRGCFLANHNLCSMTIHFNHLLVNANIQGSVIMAHKSHGVLATSLL